MIRPEAKAELMRWREALVGAGVSLVGLWWLLGGSALLTLPGAALCLGGLALVWVGVQRARFRSAGQGPGVVQVDEGQIIYYGPLTGGAVALRDMTRVTLDPSMHPAHWRLKEGTAPELLVPVNAGGADRLFDAFATLPGLRMEQVLSALKTPQKHPIVIWQKDLPISARPTLH